MKVDITIKITAFLLIFLSCNKSEKTQTKLEKKIIFSATQKFSELNKIDRTFKIFEDSTYLFTENIVDINHNKIENWEGKLQILKDSLKFFPFRSDYNRSENAVLKNGFIEFIDGEYPDRMKIEKTSLTVINLVDFKNFNDYFVFTFYKKFNNSPKEKELINQNLTTEKLREIDIILTKTFTENTKLRDLREYYKQIESVKNKKGDNIIFIHCFCKEGHLAEGYKYHLTSIRDGGNCNIFIQLNLTTGKIEVLNIAGIA